MSDQELKPWEKAQQARRARLESGEDVQVVRLNPIEKARQNPKSKSLAIRAMCYYCVGGEQAVQTIRHCTSRDCPLYPVRPYQVGSTEDAEELEPVAEAEAPGVPA
jgi:hypothetical protein